MNLDNDYDNDGNNIVPCPICLSAHCPSKEGGKCPDEAEYVKAMSHPIPQEVEEKVAQLLDWNPPPKEDREEMQKLYRQALLSVYNRGRVAAITTVWETLRPDENRDMVIPFEQIRSKLQVLSAPSSEDND